MCGFYRYALSKDIPSAPIIFLNEILLDYIHGDAFNQRDDSRH